MKLPLILLSILCYLYSVNSNNEVSLMKQTIPPIYDDSMEISSSIGSKSVEKDFDLSKNVKSNDDDFSLGDETETFSNSSGMSLEKSEEDPFNATTITTPSPKIGNAMSTQNPSDGTSPTTTNSIDIIQKITTADKDLFNDETTIKMVNEGLAVLMRTVPTEINIHQEDTITTSSPKEMMVDRNLENEDKSDMSLNLSNEEEKQTNNNKTISDDIQFDIGEKQINGDENSKIIVKNNNHSIEHISVIDTTTAEDITIPFTVTEKFFTTEDPFDVKNLKINDDEQEESTKKEKESNSMEVKQSTIFVGPSTTQTTTTHAPTVNKEEDDGEIFIIDNNKEVFSDMSTSITPTIESKSNETIAHISTSLTVSSIEENENVTDLPNSNEDTLPTTISDIPIVSSTTTESSQKTDNDNTTITTLLQEVDFSKTTEFTKIDDMSLNNDDVPNNITKSINGATEIMTLDEKSTTQFPEGKNITFDEKTIQSKENVEGSIEKKEEEEEIKVSSKSFQPDIVQVSTTTSQTTMSSTTTTPTTQENIAIEVMKNLQKSFESGNGNDTTFLGNIFSPTAEEIEYATIIISLFLIIIVIIIISVIIICKRRKENGMFRFSNSQTSTSICKIEEGSSTGQGGNYKYNGNDLLNESPLSGNRDVDLVGYGRLDTTSKDSSDRKSTSTIPIN